MPFALFLNNDRISEPFSTKAEAWTDAENRKFVTIIPSHDEDPPRRVLDMKYSIRLAEHDARPVKSDIPDHQQVGGTGDGVLSGSAG